MPRPIEEIRNELKRVDERIYSKKSLLNESPEDFGLQLGLMGFEDRKEELIRELSKAQGDPGIYIRYLEHRLEKTQEDLIQKQELKLINPDDEELKDEIDCLELTIEGLVDELKYCYSNQNIPVYEMRLISDKFDGFNIPIEELGETLITTQKVQTSISKRIYYQKKDFLVSKTINESIQKDLSGNLVEPNVQNQRGHDISKDKRTLTQQLLANSQLNARAIINGSVRIILTTPKPTLNNEILSDSLTVFKNLIECGPDKQALKEQIDKLGDVEPITNYKNFVHTLFKHNLDVEFSGRTKKLDDFNIFEIDHKEAKKIYKVLNKSDSSDEDLEITKIGSFKALDLVANTFKFHIDEEDNIISGRFKKKQRKLMEDKKFNEIYKIKLSVSMPGKFKKNQALIYRLKEFLDDNDNPDK